MRPIILPDGPLGGQSFSQLAALALRCHIYLRTMHPEPEFAKRLKPWRQMIDTESAERGGDERATLPMLVRRTEDMHELDGSDPGTDLAWLLAAYSVRSGANP